MDYGKAGAKPDAAKLQHSFRFCGGSVFGIPEYTVPEARLGAPRLCAASNGSTAIREPGNLLPEGAA
jgi:hypothetical protein